MSILSASTVEIEELIIPNSMRGEVEGKERISQVEL